MDFFIDLINRQEFFGVKEKIVYSFLYKSSKNRTENFRAYLFTFYRVHSQAELFVTRVNFKLFDRIECRYANLAPSFVEITRI